MYSKITQKSYMTKKCKNIIFISHLITINHFNLLHFCPYIL